METAERISYQAEEAKPKTPPASPERMMAAMSIILAETSISMDQPGCAATNSKTCYFVQNGKEACMSWCGRI